MIRREAEEKRNVTVQRNTKFTKAGRKRDSKCSGSSRGNHVGERMDGEVSVLR